MKLDHLFENIKNGDVLGFHYEKWYFVIGKIISFVSYKINPEQKGLLEIEHVGMVYNVKKYGNSLSFSISFSFGESTGHDKGNTTNDYIFQKIKGKYVIDSRFRNKGISLYLLPCIRKLTIKENKIVNDFWLEEKEYNALQATISVNWIQKLLRPFCSKKISNIDKFCSGQVNSCFMRLGFKNKDELPSPSEIVNQSYINKDGIVKIC